MADNEAGESEVLDTTSTEVETAEAESVAEEAPSEEAAPEAEDKPEA